LLGFTVLLPIHQSAATNCVATDSSLGSENCTTADSSIGSQTVQLLIQKSTANNYVIADSEIDIQ